MDLVLELDIILGLVDPLLEIREHRVVGTEPESIPIVVFLVGASFDLSGLHEYDEGNRIRDVGMGGDGEMTGLSDITDC